MKVAIQGLGYVGSWTARELPTSGGHRDAVSDVNGAVVDPDGIAVARMVALVGGGRSVVDAGKGDVITNHPLLALEYDVLAPAPSAR